MEYQPDIADVLAMKLWAQQISGHWNGEDASSNGVSEDEAHCANDVARTCDTLITLLEEMNTY